MKKLLMKWFPKYFRVTKQTHVDYMTFPHSSNDLMVVEIEPENNNLSESLGISEERLSYLENVSKKAIKNSETTTRAVSKVVKDIKHVNELYMCIIIIHSELERMRNPMAGLMEALSNLKRDK